MAFNDYCRTFAKEFDSTEEWVYAMRFVFKNMVQEIK